MRPSTWDDEKKINARTVCNYLSCGILPALVWLNDHSLIPGTYHTDEDGYRHEHYKMSFIGVPVLTFIALTIFSGVYGFTDAARDGAQEWDDVVGGFEIIAAGLTILLIGIASGVVAGGLYYVYNRLRQREDAGERARIIPTQTGSRGRFAREYEIVDAEGKEVKSLFNACIPCTPIKVGVWTGLPLLAIFGIVCLAVRSIFSDIEDSTWASVVGAGVFAGLGAAASGLAVGGFHVARVGIFEALSSRGLSCCGYDIPEREPKASKYFPIDKQGNPILDLPAGNSRYHHEEVSDKQEEEAYVTLQQ